MVMPRADFVVVALPLTNDIRGYLDEHRLGSFKPAARIESAAMAGGEGALNMADKRHLAGLPAAESAARR